MKNRKWNLVISGAFLLCSLIFVPAMAGTEDASAQAVAVVPEKDIVVPEKDTDPAEADVEKKESGTDSGWDGPVLSAYAGTVQGPSGKETYYNLLGTGRRMQDARRLYHVRRQPGRTSQRKPGRKQPGHLYCL